MKKVLSLLLAVTLLLSVFCVMPISADFQEVSVFTASKIDAATKKDEGYAPDKPYASLGFSSVDLTGAKSIVVTAKSLVTEYLDGECLWIRLDSPKGEVIGSVKIGKTTDGFEEFKGSIKATEGVHDLYLVSTIVTETFDRNGKVPYILKSFRLSEEEYVEEAYVPVPDSAIINHHETTWALTDEFGRKVADYEEVGPIREDKTAALFYFTTRTNTKAGLIPLNMSEFAKKHPEAKYSYDHPAWGGSPVETSHYWNEPLFGYYLSTDYFVIRKHAEMLAAAGIDVIFTDNSNNSRLYKESTDVLFKAFRDAREAGIDVPKVGYFFPFGPDNYLHKSAVMKAYLNVYKDGLYSDLWFYWEGKPLIIGYTKMLTPEADDSEDAALMEEIKNFFTFRGGQPGHASGQVLPNQWGWSENYPQKGYCQNEDGTYEEATLSASVNDSYVTKTITPYNAPFVTGRSYTDLLGPDKTEGAYKYGYFFTEQLRRALEIDPELLFITGWNEWTAGRTLSAYGYPNASLDTYDDEGSRDLEPTKGDMKDTYYTLLVDAVRKFKGAEPIPALGAEKTISLNDFEAWSDVTPEYRNFKGTYERNAKGLNHVIYENYTQRNNVIISKVARDGANMYFYAETENTLTPPSGDAWMKLYLDIDRNHITGWEGYDYVINYPSVGKISALNMDGTSTEVGSAEYKISGNKLAIKVAKSVIGIGSFIDMEFKWVDNAKGDIMNFYVDGKSAPLGRFNFVCTERVSKALSSEAKANLKDVTVVSEGSNRAIVNGGKMYIYDPDTRVTAIKLNGVMYIPTDFLKDALILKTTFENDRGMLKLDGENFVYTTVGTNTVRKDGVALKVSNPATAIYGIPYIPVTFLSEVYGLEVYESGNMVAFGKNINKSQVDALAYEF